MGDLTLLALLVALSAAGLATFGRGFFLTRLELRLASAPRDLAGTLLDSSSDAAWLAGPPAFSRAVLVVIDAWRIDFAAWREGAACPGATTGLGHDQRDATDRAGPAAGTPPRPATLPAGLPPVCYHTNRMPWLASLLRDSPRHARLYRAVADAPTVTLQRLKGLTSGSLPTFLDAAANFDAATPAGAALLLEDNLVSQLAAREAAARGGGGGARALAFLGDDTWTGLFAGLFNVSHPFPSFDVADLHSVDAGVDARLGGVIASNDWALVVAHYLGVDHVGHTHGPGHPAMAAKLTQLDASLAAVLAAVQAADAAAAGSGAHASPQRTLLVVVGDHGMTDGGNHGGASGDETDAALLLVDAGGVAAARARGVTLRSNHDDHDSDSMFRTLVTGRRRDSLHSSPPAVPLVEGVPEASGSARAPRVLDAASCDLRRATCGVGDDEAGGLRHLRVPDTLELAAATSVQNSSSDTPAISALPPIISQIDLVPTLALLLGLPIPFASLGQVLPDVRFDRPLPLQPLPPPSLGEDGGDGVFTEEPNGEHPAYQRQLLALRRELASAQALAVNAWQVHRYLHTYNGAAAAEHVGARAAADTGSHPLLPGVTVPSSLLSDSSAPSSPFPAAQLAGLRNRYMTGLRSYKAALCAISAALADRAADGEGSALGSGGNSSMEPAALRHLRSGGGEPAAPEPQSGAVAHASASAYEAAVGAIELRLQQQQEQRNSGGGTAPGHSSPATRPRSATHAAALAHHDARIMSHLAHARGELSGFLADAAAMCRSLWTRFDVVAMLWGLAVLACGCGLTLLVAVASAAASARPLPWARIVHAAAARAAVFGTLAALALSPRDTAVSLSAAARAACDATLGQLAAAPPAAAVCAALHHWREAALASSVQLPAALSGRIAVVLEATPALRWPVKAAAAVYAWRPPLVAVWALSAAWSVAVDVAAQLPQQPQRDSRPAQPLLRQVGVPQSQPRPVPIAAAAALLLWLLRLWALTTDTFITAEPRLLSVLQGAATLLAGGWIAAAAQPARPASEGGLHAARAGRGADSEVLLALLVALAAGALTEQSSGALAFPTAFPADAMSPATAQAAAAAAAVRSALPPTGWFTGACLLLMPALLAARAWAGQQQLCAARTGQRATAAATPGSSLRVPAPPPLPRCCGWAQVGSFTLATANLAGCFAHWRLQLHVPLSSAAVALRLALPSSIFAAAAAHGALVCAAVALTQRGGRGRALPAAASLHATAALLPPLVLLLGPRSPPVLLALLAHTWALCSLTRALCDSGDARGGAVDVATPLLPDSQAAAGGGAPASVSEGGGSRRSRAGAPERSCSLLTRLLPPLTRLLPPLALRESRLPLLALLWGLLPAHYYLATGHGNVLASLDFASPAVVAPRYSRLTSGGLLLASTYGTHALVLACGAAPLLAADASAAAVGDAPRRVRPPPLSPAALLALPACVALVSSAFCVYARRHLMVWAVFAPKWLFDAGGFLATAACVAAAVLGGTRRKAN